MAVRLNVFHAETNTLYAKANMSNLIIMQDRNFVTYDVKITIKPGLCIFVIIFFFQKEKQNISNEHSNSKILVN